MILSKDNISQLVRKNKLVDIKEYDVQVKIQAMSLSEQLNVEENSKADKNKFVSNVLMYCCVDEDNNKLFVDQSEVERLPADLSLVLFKECLKINNLGEKDVENLAKNL